MDIRGIAAPPSPVSAPPPARPVTESLPVHSHNKAIEPASQTQSDGASAVTLPFSATLQLDIDQSTKQVYAKVIDPETGSLLREIPDPKLRALQAFAIKALKPIIDEKV
jgi:uncharacterized FlaG/YvyC family protein